MFYRLYRVQDLHAPLTLNGGEDARAWAAHDLGQGVDLSARIDVDKVFRVDLPRKDGAELRMGVGAFRQGSAYGAGAGDIAWRWIVEARYAFKAPKRAAPR